MRYLELGPARILESLAWRLPRAPSGRFHIRLEDDWELNVLGYGTRERHRPLISIPADLLTLSVGTAQIRSGGGWIGGGFGVTGAAVGAAEASVLNALTVRDREYSLLTVLCTESNDTVRRLVFGFRAIDESDLRDRLSAAIPEWIEPLVQKIERKIVAGMSEDDLNRTRKQLWLMVERGMLTDTQQQRLQVAQGQQQPAVRAGQVPERRQDVRILSRVEQLKILADLRQSGALSDAEFEAEKHRLMQSE